MLYSRTTVFVDGHVHIYHCYQAEQLFDAAWRHFSTAAEKFGVAEDFEGVLILTESAGDKVFQELAEGPKQSIGRWHVASTREPAALRLQRDEARLLLLAGRQLVSAERLEISAYFVTETLADGAPLDILLEQVDRAGGVAVLPWGVGKWLGKRGREVERTLMRREVPLMLSDNGGRPWLWPTPRLFRTAEQIGIPVLAGTDPLPKVSQQNKAGGFGFLLKGAISPDAPAQDMKNRLLTLDRSPLRYGKLEGGYNFVRNQLSMQFQRTW